MKSRFWKRLLFFLRRNQFEQEFQEELEVHQQMLQQENEHNGMPAEDARYAAQRKMGNLTRTREDAREIWFLAPLQSIWQDLCYATRTLRQNPSFTLVALLALGLGIGMNTSLFTIFNAFALRPWPVKDPATLVSIFNVPLKEKKYRGLSYPAYAYYRDHTKTLSGIVVSRSTGSLAFSEASIPIKGEYISGNYFSVTGADIAVGRAFFPEEDQVGKPQQVAVLSYTFWQSRLGENREIVGKTIALNNSPFLVIGITAPDFKGTRPDVPDIWLPAASLPIVDPGSKDLTEADNCCFDILGRLNPGNTRQQAQAELSVLEEQYAKEQRRESFGVFIGRPTFLATPDRQQKIFPVMALALCAVAMVLLIACANIANLLLARAAARQKEIGVRLSLGASRARIVRQLMTESFLLALLGGLLGIVIAYRLPSFLMSQFTDEPLSFRFVPDATVLGYTLALSILASIAFGLVPALHATRTSLNMALQGNRLLFGTNIQRSRLRSLLLGAQIAFCLILLIGAGLFTRGLQRAQTTDPGFATKNVAVFSLDLRLHNYDQRLAESFLAQLQDRIKALPGVESAALAGLVPLGNTQNRTTVSVTEREANSRNRSDKVFLNTVSPEFITTLKIPIAAGRSFTTTDVNGPCMIVINQSMARHFWPDQNAIGRVSKVGDRTCEVIGITKDTRNAHLSDIDVPYLYQLYQGDKDSFVFVRTSGDPKTLIAELPRVVSSLDPQVKITVKPLSENLKQWIEVSRNAAAIAASLGLLALTLACIGIYGVVVYSVQQRTREIGIRMALGAQKSQVLSLILRQNLRAVVIGAILGMVGAAALSRALTRFLYGLSPLDPIAFGAVSALLIAAALLASYLPAKQATAVDPLVALRYE